MFYLVHVFSYAVLFVSAILVIGCEERLRNDPIVVRWSVKSGSPLGRKLCSNSQCGITAADTSTPAENQLYL